MAGPVNCNCTTVLKKRIVWWIKFIVPIAVAFAFLFNFVVLDPSRPKASPMLGVTILTALGWVLEHIPITITAFLPLVLVPLCQISSADVISASMFSDTSLVFLGGFIFSVAMIRWNLHSRLALKVVLICGLRPKILFLGLLLVTAFLGMWISNTACALTMIPNATAIVTKLEEILGDSSIILPFAKALYLGIAFASSAGGFSTLTGTPANLIFSQVSQSVFPNAPTISWTKFLFISLPTAWTLCIIIYVLFLFTSLRKIHLPPDLDMHVFRENYARLGRMKPAEIFITLAFVLLACLWLFRSDLDFGGFVLKGWTTAIFGPKASKYIKDGTVALGCALLLFVIYVPQPTATEEKTLEKHDVDLEVRKTTTANFKETEELGDDPDGDNSEDSELQEEISEVSVTIIPPIPKNEWVALLEWEYVQSKIPWSILFLFSGGFALNQGFKDSGLDLYLGEKLKGVMNLDHFSLLLIISLITTVLTNICSNTATANILLPIIANIAKMGKKYHPWIMMLVCTFMTSSCYLMPVSTPPNLIAYGTGKLKTSDFLVNGAIMNVVSIFLIIGFCMGLVPAVFGDTQGYPKWG